MFVSRNKKNNVYPCKPQFYYIKVGFKGVKIILVCFRDGHSFMAWLSFVSLFHLPDLQHEKMNLLTCLPNENTNQLVHQHSLINIFIVYMKRLLHPWLSKMHPVKILIRLSECTG